MWLMKDFCRKKIGFDKVMNVKSQGLFYTRQYCNASLVLALI